MAIDARVREAAAIKDEASDEALVRLARRDRQAFGALYDRYVGPIYRYCRGRLGNQADAEDATSLIFTRALAALPTHRGPSFRSWLFTIAHNVVINMRRDAGAVRLVDSLDQLTAAGPSLDDLAVNSERVRSLQDALPLLPEDQRRVVELRLAGLTGLEIAATTGRSHDAVRSSQRRALACLRTLLDITRDTREHGHDG